MAETATLPEGPCDDFLSPDRAALARADAGVALPDLAVPDVAVPDAALLWVPESHAPLHCGAPMEWRSPKPVAVSSTALEPAEHSAALPALWRCPCGFQLDGVDQGVGGLVSAY